MTTQQLLDRLEQVTELQDGSATEDMSPTYFEVDGDAFKAAIEELRAFVALKERIEQSAASMENQPTGRFLAAHLRELLNA